MCTPSWHPTEGPCGMAGLWHPLSGASRGGRLRLGLPTAQTHCCCLQPVEHNKGARATQTHRDARSKSEWEERFGTIWVVRLRGRSACLCAVLCCWRHSWAFLLTNILVNLVRFIVSHITLLSAIAVKTYSQPVCVLSWQRSGCACDQCFPLWGSVTRESSPSLVLAELY